MNLDWGRLHAVVLESDDWGLCAWIPDEQAHRVLADTPVFRSPAGLRYGTSTLESADDVRLLAETLSVFRGRDGFPPVWQANTVMAAPDYSRLRPPAFETDALPLVDLPQTPSRWQRPRLWEQVMVARLSGLWWPELHGLHHLPERAWLEALRRGADDARRALEQQSPVCAAVQASSEYDPSEPVEVRARNLELAIDRFTRLMGRAPDSFCPPDYRWDESLEADAERRGITTLQGKAEQQGASWPRLRRLLNLHRWPWRNGARFYLPPRISFEPIARDPALGALAAHHVARDAWGRGQPAVISSHRVNYAQLDPEAAEAGRASLRDLLSRLSRDGAVFLTDHEVRQLVDRRWSLRPVGDRGVLLRYYAVPREPVRFPAPKNARGAALREGHDADADVFFEPGEVTVRANVGEYLIEWANP
ncbi:MAG TPA: hypothetical protein VMJ70_06605 [Candidatus Sulfotelmatobacter sp.]|nr:hypothetical protein [Candidatus Sulfotelmatobacter sp.]